MLSLCKGDPLVDALLQTFRAQPIRVPEERIVPLVVFQMEARNRLRYLGQLREMVTPKANKKLAELKTERSGMASLESTRSGSVDIKLGLKVLDGFLRGFGLSSCFPSISTQLSRASNIAFAFQHVRRVGVSPAAVGNGLAEKTFEIDNAVIAGAISAGGGRAE